MITENVKTLLFVALFTFTVASCSSGGSSKTTNNNKATASTSSTESSPTSTGSQPSKEPEGSRPTGGVDESNSTSSGASNSDPVSTKPNSKSSVSVSASSEKSSSTPTTPNVPTTSSIGSSKQSSSKQSSSTPQTSSSKSPSNSHSDSTLTSSSPSTPETTKKHYELSVNIFGVRFNLAEATVTEINDSNGIGLEVNGDIFIETPAGSIPMYSTAARVVASDESMTTFTSIYGESSLPFPAVGLLKNIEFSDLASVKFGFNQGKNLLLLDAPVKEERSYLVYDVQAGFEASVGSLTFEAKNNIATTFLLDPFDPSFYFHGSLPGLNELGVDNIGIGMSLQGLLPFTPDTTWNVEKDIKAFDANLLLQGVIPFAKYPFSIDGEVAVLFEMSDKNGALGIATPELTLGGNGILNLDLDLNSAIGLTIELGSASMSLIAKESKQEAVISGVVENGNPFEAIGIPIILPKQSVKMSGRFAGLPSPDFELGSLVESSIDGSALSSLVGINLDNIAGQEMSITVSPKGVRMTGEVSSGLHPDVVFGAGAFMEANFTGDPKDWEINIEGNIGLAGIDLASASLDLDSSGFKVKGDFDTGVSNISMSGEVNDSGINLTGTSSINIPFEGEITNLIVSGAICGFNTVTDAGKCGTEFIANAAVCGSENVADGALCGFNTVTSAAQCGAQTITSAAVCGSSVVSSAAQCGVTAVTDGAVCGFSTVTDGAICGTQKVTDAGKCGVELLGELCAALGICERTPKTCNIAKSCKVAKTCNKPKTCSIAKSCKQAKTCKIAASCPQPKKCNAPKTCKIETKCEVKEVKLGEFKGNTLLSLGNKGLSADLQGEYCLNNKCEAIAGGRLDLSKTPAVCITIPAGIGEVCAPL